MKTITVTKFTGAANKRAMTKDETEMVLTGPEEMDASDGYHTFTELYNHRIGNFIALCKALKALSTISSEIGADRTLIVPVWRSKEHHVGGDPMYDDWFIMGIFTAPGEQISYHLPIACWDETNFADTLDNAPEWDGHTPADVITRLKEI